jgi:hypothetical protein
VYIVHYTCYQLIETLSSLILFRRFCGNCTLPRTAIIVVSIWSLAKRCYQTDNDTMPPRRGTPWASHGSLLSDRIRPPSRSPQPTKLEKGKGKAKAATPEPPPRGAAVRKLDELLDGLRSSPTSNQQPKNETRKVTVQGAGASADREGCFCQGQPLPSVSLPLFRLPPNPLFHIQTLNFDTNIHCSPNTRIIRIHSHLRILRSRPLRPTTSIPSLSTLQRAAPHASRASGARGAAGGTTSSVA